MPPIIQRSTGREVTLPQILAVLTIWAGVIYGLTHTGKPEAEQISLKNRSALTVCAPQG
jgi:hypothetical protein